MAAKRNNLYLYLALVCFLGIIVIFIFDGYMGVYDRLVMDNGQYQQRVEADQWSPERYSYLASTGVERGGRVTFTYTVENHRFSTYSGDVAVTLWHNEDKIADLMTATLVAGAFGEASATWVVDSEAVVPAGYPVDVNYNVNVVITRGDVERRAMLNISPSYVPKPVPAR